MDAPTLPVAPSSAPTARTLIVIPALNEATHIEDVLGRLAGDEGAADAPIWVMDGGSTDGTQAIVERLALDNPRIRLIANSKRLQSAAINLAVALAGDDHDVLVRCDAHAGYPHDYASALVRTLVDTQADSVVVAMDSRGSGCVQRAVAWVSDSRIGNGGSAHRGGRVSGFVDHGHHAAFRLAALRAVGGYDETFSHNEDAELDCRLRAAGMKIYLDASVRLTYFPRNSLSSLWRQYRAYGAGRARTVRRHPDSLRLRQCLVPAHVLVSLACLSASFWHPLALAWPAAYVVALGIASIDLAAKNRSACALLCGVAAATMHFGWAAGFIRGMCRREAPAGRSAAPRPHAR